MIYRGCDTDVSRYQTYDIDLHAQLSWLVASQVGQSCYVNIKREHPVRLSMDVLSLEDVILLMVSNRYLISESNRMIENRKTLNKFRANWVILAVIGRIHVHEILLREQI